MIPSEQSVFYKFMRDIFSDEWPSVPPFSPDHLARWFRALEFIDMARIKKAFAEYLCDSRQSKFPPKEGQILEIIKTLPFDIRLVRCSWETCSDVGIDRLGDYFYCRNHCDEMILKNDPDSSQADVIRESRRLALEAKEFGISTRAYFEKCEPAFFNSINKMRGDGEIETARKKIVRALQDFYDTPLSVTDRQKILAELREVAKDCADRVKCAVNA